MSFLQDLENTKVRVLFVSEGNVCRSVYAEAIFNSLIEEQGMQEFVECASKVRFSKYYSFRMECTYTLCGDYSPSMSCSSEFNIRNKNCG